MAAVSIWSAKRKEGSQVGRCVVPSLDRMGKLQFWPMAVESSLSHYQGHQAHLQLLQHSAACLQIILAVRALQQSNAIEDTGE